MRRATLTSAGVPARNIGPAPGARPRAARDPVVRVLAAQRVLGNARVAQLLQRARPLRGAAAGRPLLQRFAGPEHEALGNTLHTDIELGHGVTLSWGQLLAIAGDEIGTIDQLLAAPSTEEGRHRIGASIINAELQAPVPAALRPTADQLAAHKTEFQLLALENADHFPDSGRAIGAWSRHHAVAIDKAVAAGFARDAHAIHTAYAYEAFGQHFLTDCYSGGHLRTPRAQIIDWYMHWAEHAADALVEGIIRDLTSRLTMEADPQTWAPTGRVRARVEDKVRPAVQGAIASNFGGMPKFRRLLGLGIAGAISGTMHDREGVAGVLVGTDDHPEPWRAYGDGKLKSSPVSFEQATKAIAAAKGEVDRAYAIGVEERAKVAGRPQADVLAAGQAATARARSELKPPYGSVMRFIPRPVEERGTATWGNSNKPLADWHWGHLGWKFLDALNDYVRNVVGTTLVDGVAKSKDVKDEISDDGVVVHPRRALADLVREFMAFPVDTLGGLIGEPAAEPSPTPAGSKTPPIAPPEEGEEPVPDPSVPWPYGTPLPY